MRESRTPETVIRATGASQGLLAQSPKIEKRIRLRRTKFEKRKSPTPLAGWGGDRKAEKESLRGMGGSEAIWLRLLRGQYGHDRVTMNMRRAL